MRIDLNCDMGESFGAWRLGADEELLAAVTSANIACGMHAGDPAVMHRTVAAAARHGVAIGAHPGFPDLAGFGRREMALTPQEIYDITIYQVGALLGFARAAGVPLTHVKAHGALYNAAARRRPLAEAIAAAVRDVDATLVLFGLAGSELIAAAEAAGLRAASEVFADRNYQADGSLVPRSSPEALIGDAAEAVRRVVRMVREGRVQALSGEDVPVRADTACVHGDGPHALQLARALREGLEREGIQVLALRQPGG